MPQQPAPGPAGWGPAGAPPPPAAPAKKGRGAVVWVIGVILVVLVIAGVVAFALGVFDSSSSVTDAAVEECTIGADGTMVAAGWVTAEERVTLEVRFEDAESGKELDRVTVTPRGPVSRRQVWTAEGTTDDDAVQKVTCVLEDAG
jgi:FlaG/FlaF family flagellin (archaellin)